MLLIRWCLARHKLARLTASLVPCAIDAETSEVVRQAAGLSRLPPILASREIPVPVVIGHRRPVVAIPEALIRSGDRTALRDVLIHECAHVARRDPWVHLVQRCAAVLYWPHPGVHGVNAIISRAREEICDNHVLMASPPVEFARTLLEMSERLVGVRMVPAPLGLLGTRWSLESRVEGLLDPRRHRMTRLRPVWLVPVCVLFAVLGAALGGLRRSEAAPPLAEPAVQTLADKNESGSRKSFLVKGRVVLRGKPVEEVEVIAFAFVNGAWTVAAKVTTDAAGAFVLSELPIPSSDGTRVMPLIAAKREGFVTGAKWVDYKDVASLGPKASLEFDLNLVTSRGSDGDGPGWFRKTGSWSRCVPAKCRRHADSGVIQRQDRLDGAIPNRRPEVLDSGGHRILRSQNRYRHRRRRLSPVGTASEFCFNGRLVLVGAGRNPCHDGDGCNRDGGGRR